MFAGVAWQVLEGSHPNAIIVSVKPISGSMNIRFGRKVVLILTGIPFRVVTIAGVDPACGLPHVFLGMLGAFIVPKRPLTTIWYLCWNISSIAKLIVFRLEYDAALEV